jgi:hypothetical protein
VDEVDGRRPPSSRRSVGAAIVAPSFGEGNNAFTPTKEALRLQQYGRSNSMTTDRPTDADPYLAAARRYGWRPSTEDIGEDFGIWQRIALGTDAMIVPRGLIVWRHFGPNAVSQSFVPMEPETARAFVDKCRERLDRGGNE